MRSLPQGCPFTLCPWMPPTRSSGRRRTPAIGLTPEHPQEPWPENLLQWMLDSWSPKGVYIWDLATAVEATDPALCPEVPLAVDILVAPGPDQGRTVITDQTPNVSVCLDPDPGQIQALAEPSWVADTMCIQFPQNPPLAKVGKTLELTMKPAGTPTVRWSGEAGTCVFVADSADHWKE